ncbi:CPBP family intramembrane metalloprotease [Acholeplasma equirhinis]|uniref:CPBP family intramembrane glutamic endopeptidase n=1 Tax=Acholeplasma equirhinis TaxID=555393 RepID=UPI00197AD439|nr:CPBP family intramembrane glutamic endopeptidase [Acholeplasma equirhinis]MBN3490557.1 CPBP family intramembrane metalloprotease [Acholeplasma equirhinis]
MQEQLDQIENEFKSLHDDEHEFNDSQKPRFAFAILTYLAYLIVPSIIVLLILAGSRDNSFIFKQASAVEMAIESAFSDVNGVLIIKTEDMPAFKPYQKILMPAYEKDGYTVYLNSYASFFTNEQDLGNVEVIIVDYRYQTVLTEQGFLTLISREKTNWANSATVNLYIAESSIPDFLPNETVSYLTTNNLLLEPSILINDTFSDIFSFVLYAAFSGILIVLLRPSLAKDLDPLKKIEKSTILGQTGLGVLYLFAGGIITNVIVSLLNTTLNIPEEISANQLSINRSLMGPLWFVMVIVAVVGAPIVEELVFRKAIFGLIKNQTVALIVSAVAFGSIHITTELLEGDMLLALTSGLSYIISGVLLGLIYIQNKKNIYMNMFIHGAYNLVAMILTIISLM